MEPGGWGGGSSRGTWTRKWSLGAGDSSVWNHLKQGREPGREKQSQAERTSVEGGYLPENETESTLVFLRLRMLLLLTGLKRLRRRQRETERELTVIRVGRLSTVYLRGH